MKKTARIAPASQRLVLRGRILDDGEILETLSLESGTGAYPAQFRLFLAVSKSGSASSANTGVSSSSMGAGNPVPASVTSPQTQEVSLQQRNDHGFEVLVRWVDADEDKRVYVAGGSSIIDFKREALLRLQACPDFADSCVFVFDGRMLASDISMQESGLEAGAHIIVVPPRIRASRGKCCNPKYFLVWLRSWLTALWLFAVSCWHDPWTLVRPRGEEEIRRRNRIRLLQVNARNLRYAPGNNPNGEDFTLLFSQGLLS